MAELVREWRFALRSVAVRRATAAAFVLSLLAVWSGMATVADQRALLQTLEHRIDLERELALAAQSDAGGAAYYGFHLTYSPPSTLSFVSNGVRDALPWKHRIRMLALEGQIYESDAGNPALSALGRLDFAFFAAVLMPLLLVLLLFDLWSSERDAGRLAILSATSANGSTLIAWRAAARTSLLVAAVLIPVLIGASISRAAWAETLAIVGVVAANGVFWAALCTWTGRRITSGATTVGVLLGFWLVLTVALPVAGRLIAERAVAVPNGGELLLTQRETVNAAWDQPKAATMTPFADAHPEWQAYTAVRRPFEWKWYYAFQWLGDHRASPLSVALRRGVAERDRIMGRIAWLTPTLLTERLLSRLARTDVTAYLNYEQCVRDFHAELRHFYYPMLFGAQAFDAGRMSQLPEFTPCTSAP